MSPVMFNTPSATSQETSKNRYRSARGHKHYDWRLWSRKARNDASPLLPSAGNATSLPDELLNMGPAVSPLAGQPPMTTTASSSNGLGGMNRSVDRMPSPTGRLLLFTSPGSQRAPSPGSFPSRPLWSSSPVSSAPLSRTTSVSTSLDDVQERCANAAYRVSFHGDNRVKDRPCSVTINGTTFVLVDRGVCGQSDGVYAKSKKIWEHVPRGQTRVFVAALTTPLSSLPSTPVMLGGAYTGGTPVQVLPDSAYRGSSSGVGCVSPSNRSFTSTSAAYTLLATLNGLRKFGHWGDPAAVTIYTVNKEVPVTAVGVEMVDGEGGQLTALQHDGVRYWLVGCREKHLLVRLTIPDEDVNAYVEDMDAATAANVNACSTLLLAKRIALAWRRTLTQHLTVDQVEQLHEAVCQAQWTLCFDALIEGWEHLVDYSEESGSGAGRGPGGAGLSNGTSSAATTTTATATEHVSIAVPSGNSSASHIAPPRSPSVSSAAVFAHSSAGGEGGAGGSRKDSYATDTFSEPVVDEDGDEDELWFYAITSPDTSAGAGLCLPVEEAMAFFHRFHLQAVPYSTAVALGSVEYGELRNQIMSKLNSAGAVFYGFNEAGVVVRLWKCGNYPHTLERAVQESIVTHRLHGDALRLQLQKKITKLPKDTRVHTGEWERVRLPLLLRFSSWLHATKQLTPSMDSLAARELRGSWITAQHAFLHGATPSFAGGAGKAGTTILVPGLVATDGDELDDSESETASGSAVRRGSGVNAGNRGDIYDDAAAEDEGADAEGEGEEEEEEEEQHPPEVIMLVGPQGCGKSTMARALYALLQQAGSTPRWINQDEIGDRRGYLAAIRRAATSGEYTHIILDKMNLDRAARADYDALNLKVILVVAWRHTQGAEALVEVCFERVKRRGAGHRTFKAGSDGPPGKDAAASASSGGSRRAAGTPSPAPPPASPSTSDAGERDKSSEAAQWRRLRGILKESVDRYELPVGEASLLELDVGLNCNAAMQRLWTRLQDCGLYDLPSLPELDVEDAFETSFEYERLLQCYRHKVTMAVLQANDPNDVLECLPDTMTMDGKKACTEVQVVLHNFLEQPCPVTLVRYAGVLGKTISVRLRLVVSDCKATVVHVNALPGHRPAGANGCSSGGGGCGLAGGTGCAGGPRRGLAPRWTPLPLGEYTTPGEGDTRNCATPTSSTTAATATSMASATATSGGGGAGEAVPSPPLLAVVAKVKKTSQHYCEDLLERVLRNPREPYCTVKEFPSLVVVPFTFQFVFSSHA